MLGGVGIAFLGFYRQNTGADTAFQETAQKTDKNYTRLVMAYSSTAAGTDEQEMVEEAINEITRRKLGIEIEFQVAYENYPQKINHMLAGKEQLDIIYRYQDMDTNLLLNDSLWELEDLLEEYGQGIIDAVGQNIINTCKVRGRLYGLPNNRDYAVGYDAYILQKDLLDKYNIDASWINTIDDLEHLFAFIRNAEPDIQVVASEGSSLLSNCYFANGMGDSLGVHMDYGQSRELVNLYETMEYKEALLRVRNWYLKGYTQNTSGDKKTLRKRMEEGTLFSYVCRNKPGYEQQESYSCGRDLVCIQLGENIITDNAPSAFQWSITKNTISPQKSMELLNLLYTDPEIMNLLSYGIEGEHYVFTEDGHITFPDGQNTNPFIGDSWKMPNQFITQVWEGNPLNLWEEMRKFNEEAIHGVDFGFNFDFSTIATKYVALKEIRDKYTNILENGLVNPVEGLEEFNKELKANFVDEVIAEKQRQFDEFIPAFR